MITCVLPDACNERMDTMKDYGLNDRQREFARLLAKGMKQADAYRKAFDCKGKSESAIHSHASRLAKNGKVCEFLADMRKEADTEAVMSKRERMESLTRIAKRSEQYKPREAIAAIAELNKMDGAYEPEKVELSGSLGVGAVVAALQQGEVEPLVR